MELHRRYYSEASEPPRRYSEIQKRIGSFLREQYEPPKDLPHRLFTLLMEADNQEDDS
jgi:hypothetical protein